MKVFTCTNFEGFYPVGTAAVVVAENVTEADMLLRNKLNSIGLQQDDELILEELSLNSSVVVILRDGNY